VNKCAARIIFSAALLFAWIEGVHGQVLDPITVSLSSTPIQGGEVESLEGIPPADNPPGVLQVSNSGEYFYLQGDNLQNLCEGLPDDGTIVSESNTADKIATFQLASNVLVSNGTLTLATPASYSNLAVLVDSIGPPRGDEPAMFTLYFSDGTSDPIPLNTVEAVPSLSGGVPGVTNGSVAYSKAALYSRAQGFDDSAVNLDEYDFTLSAADAAKTLVSIDVNANGGDLVTYAVSGTDPPSSEIPEPPTLALLALAFGVALLARWLRPLAAR
jgi:hypothetical protein